MLKCTFLTAWNQAVLGISLLCFSSVISLYVGQSFMRDNAVCRMKSYVDLCTDVRFCAIPVHKLHILHYNRAWSCLLWSIWNVFFFSYFQLLQAQFKRNKTEKPFSLQDDSKTDKSDMNYKRKNLSNNLSKCLKHLSNSLSNYPTA